MRIGLVAGELSGDTLGAGLIAELARRYPQATFEGIGGPKMRAAGLDVWHDCEVLAVMGLTEVLKHLPRLMKLRRGLVARWRQRPPDVFVGIDAPDFNLGLELRLRKQGIRTVHYVSPSVWAWREKRVYKIAKACDRVLCLLPFEPDFYAQHGVQADFVGHPLANAIAPVDDLGAAREAAGVASDRTVLTVLPGSRHGEIARLGDTFAAAIRRLSEARPDSVVLVPLANDTGEAQFRALPGVQALPDNVRISQGDAAACMRAADVLLCASGTVTLEGLLHGKPMVMAYKLAPSTYRIVKSLNLVKLQHFSLPNLLTATPWVPEFIQDAATPAALSEAVHGLLSDTQRRASIREAFADVHATLARNADVRAADAVAQLALP